MTTQVLARRNGRLDRDKARRLESLQSWTWDPFGDAWMENFEVLQRRVAETGSARVPFDEVFENVRLGGWVLKQRQTYKRGHLSAERARLLEAQPHWYWDPKEADWEANFDALTRYVRATGNAGVPVDHVEDGVPLGRWVTTQRQAKKRGSITSDQVARLEALPGWSWNTRESQWLVGFRALERYVEREGHAHVPRQHTEGHVALGAWAIRQRVAYRNGELRHDRVAKLEAVPGWSWGDRSKQEP